MKRLGCSSRLGVILAIIMLALFLTSFAMGPLGSKLFRIEVPESLQVTKPHVVLPSEAIPSEEFYHGWGGFKITNTLISSWITILILFLVFFLATRKMKIIPGRLQSFAEVIVDGIHNAIQGVAGAKHTRTFFPIVTTIFLYVVTNALLALVPLWGTWGPIEHGEEGTFIVPFLRAANTDVNLTLSIALISFCYIEYVGLSKTGPFKYIDSFFQFSSWRKIFGHLFKGRGKSFLVDFFFGIINLFVGFLEVISHFIRIVSFTFRLFGNMTAGEILLGVMTFLIAFLAPVPFYGLETLVGFLQAMIFAGLTLVFGVMAVSSHHDEATEHS